MNAGTRYRWEQISKVTGLPVHRLEEKRRFTRVDWNANGYTVDEVRAILMGAPLLPREQINPRAFKALELWDRLAEEEA